MCSAVKYLEHSVPLPTSLVRIAVRKSQAVLVVFVGDVYQNLNFSSYTLVYSIPRYDDTIDGTFGSVLFKISLFIIHIFGTRRSSSAEEEVSSEGY